MRAIPIINRAIHARQTARLYPFIQDTPLTRLSEQKKKRETSLLSEAEQRIPVLMRQHFNSTIVVVMES